MEIRNKLFFPFQDNLSNSIGLISTPAVIVELLETRVFSKLSNIFKYMVFEDANILMKNSMSDVMSRRTIRKNCFYFLFSFIQIAKICTYRTRAKPDDPPKKIVVANTWTSDIKHFSGEMESPRILMADIIEAADYVGLQFNIHTSSSATKADVLIGKKLNRYYMYLDISNFIYYYCRYSSFNIFSKHSCFCFNQKYSSFEKSVKITFF